MSSEDGGQARGSKRRGPREATRENLERAALSYLDRFDSTAENLRRVLLRHVHRSARAHGTDVEEGRRIVGELIARYRDSGLLNDTRYAATMARGLRDRGQSARAIRHKLQARGVPDDALARAIDDAGIAGPEQELVAARVFAKKRRLGPFRPPEKRLENRRRDLAALARAGFGPDVARAILQMDPGKLEPSDDEP